MGELVRVCVYSQIRQVEHPAINQTEEDTFDKWLAVIRPDFRMYLYSHRIACICPDSMFDDSSLSQQHIIPLF